MKIQVSEDTLKQIEKSGCLEDLLIDKAKFFSFNGENFVYTASFGDHVETHKAILLPKYRGSIPALKYCDHVEAVDNGIRERGYSGRIVYVKNVLYVLTDKVIFENNKIKQNETPL